MYHLFRCLKKITEILGGNTLSNLLIYFPLLTCQQMQILISIVQPAMSFFPYFLQKPFFFNFLDLFLKSHV